jgi:hypothetical protein
MALLEHEFSAAKGKPVTMLREGQNDPNRTPIFLMQNENFPEAHWLDQKKPGKVVSIADCSGFCGANDLEVDLFENLNIPTVMIPWRPAR